ncbi:hypothetical protein SDC9_116647 [bioreactor metagenome]|uniref:Uncharacterized protein n=1 Tax=bioreactor metagenome TaxID=1076179 RepID=A0A645BWB1_9ZZZZ
MGIGAAKGNTHAAFAQTITQHLGVLDDLMLQLGKLLALG